MNSWGRFATLGLGFVALMAGQLTGLMAITWWYGVGLAKLPDFSGDGVAVALIIFISTPVQLVLLIAFAKRAGSNALDYLGLTLPSRSEVIFGIVAVVAFIILGDGLSWMLGKSIVTPFQNEITRTAGDSGGLSLLLLWLAVIVVTPIGEETLFRGFLFRGWLRSKGDAWPVIVIVALLWALIHVQYDWYVISQVFVSGLMLGWIRWASGSTVLTILLHGLINFEGMIETLIGLKWLT